MQTGLIRLITTQKVLKTCSNKSVKQHYLGSNHVFKINVGTMIENSILEAVYGKDITHPSLNTELC